MTSTVFTNHLDERLKHRRNIRQELEELVRDDGEGLEVLRLAVANAIQRCDASTVEVLRVVGEEIAVTEALEEEAAHLLGIDLAAKQVSKGAARKAMLEHGIDPVDAYAAGVRPGHNHLFVSVPGLGERRIDASDLYPAIKARIESEAVAA